MPKTGWAFSFTHSSVQSDTSDTMPFYCVLRRAAVADGGLLVRMKYHVYSVLANISAALPCISNWSSGLPRVTGPYDVIRFDELRQFLAINGHLFLVG